MQLTAPLCPLNERLRIADFASNTRAMPSPHAVNT